MSKKILSAYNAIDHTLFSKLSQRDKTIYMYRSILRLANGWEPDSQREDIRNETRSTFQKNKYLTDPEMINDKIEEARSRMLTALHYNIPYEKKKYNIPKYQIQMKPPPDPKDESNIC
ncbi:hypothetical protein RB653_006178 [Dictyostelium firmibasis]|uniref:Complex 1 LYR protein domain-containing protein n=1 Tax=Dictyostelium firmibasis TaxID=79012 RepID=A0AAN7UE05_9MYCE